LRRKIQVHQNTAKKYLSTMRFHRKAKKSVPKTTARQKSVIEARLKLLTQNFFSAKSIYKCVMDDESYFMVDRNAWQQQTYYEFEDHHRGCLIYSQDQVPSEGFVVVGCQ
jgi:hypothetical protein